MRSESSQKNSICPCFNHKMLKTEFISFNNCILWTLFHDIKQKGNFYIYSFLWKCQQGRYPSRIYISSNKSLGSPVEKSLHELLLTLLMYNMMYSKTLIKRIQCMMYYSTVLIGNPNISAYLNLPIRKAMESDLCTAAIDCVQFLASEHNITTDAIWENTYLSCMYFVYRGL